MALDIDPVETAEELRADSERDARNEKLNGLVAITVAILATFLGIFNVKDDNVVQAMLAAQAEVIDQWSFFQARNIREEVMLATVEQLTVERATHTDPTQLAALIRKPIKELVAELDAEQFWQIHRSTLVNARAIAGVSRDLRGRQLVAVRGHPEKLEVSRSYAGLFKGM